MCRNPDMSGLMLQGSDRCLLRRNAIPSVYWELLVKGLPTVEAKALMPLKACGQIMLARGSC